MTGASLAGKVAVVTGAGNGIGQASAVALSRAGVRVVVVDINGEAAAAVASRLPFEACAVQADVSDEHAVAAYVAAAVERFGRIDLHHLNAGIFGTHTALPEVTSAEFDHVMAVNLRGTFLGIRAAFRQFEEQESAGAIVVTASIASLTGSADLIAYQTSKHGVVGLVHGSAVYGGPLGIRVNAVAPGIVPTDLFASAAAAAGGKNDMAVRASTTPLRRAGSADEIASVAVFLLSEDAAYMTGQIVSVDGGATIVNTVRPSGGAGAWDTGTADRITYAGIKSGAPRHV